MEMKLTHRMVLFAFLGDADHTAHERIVGTVMILRANWWRSYKARNLDADKVAQLSGLDTAAVLTAAASLVARGWFEMAEDGDGYGLAPERLAQAQARHEEHNQRVKERAKQARAEARAA